MIKRFKIISYNVNQQKYFARAFYSNKLKVKFMKFIIASNFEFLDHAQNVIKLTSRVNLRRLFYGIVDYKNKRKIYIP